MPACSAAIPREGGDLMPPAPRRGKETPAFAGAHSKDKPKRSTHMVRPFGHRVTLTAAPLLERDETANVQLAFRGVAPEGWAPLGGFGRGVKCGRRSTNLAWSLFFWKGQRRIAKLLRLATLASAV